MSQQVNPRTDTDCPDCPGEFVYQEQDRNARGQLVAVFECADCGRTEQVR